MQKIITIVLLISLNHIFSQEITIKYNDTTITYKVLTKQEGDSLNYYETAYYKNDANKTAWKKLVVNNYTTGVYKEYFPNGKLYKKVVYNLHGEKNGIYQEWDENGKLTISGQYKNNLKTGTWQYYKEKRFEVYKKGKKHGRWRIYEGKTPWTLYIYKNDSLIRVKK